jgi:hypothetical protein
MGKENHRLLRYDEPPRSGFVQLAVYPDIGPQPVAVSHLIDTPTADRSDF